MAGPHDGFALAPDAERALAAEEGWLSERGGRCPTPPPRPAAVPCSISAMVQGRLTPPMCLAHRRGTAEQPSQLSQGARRRGDKRSPTIRTGAQQARLTKNLANVSGDHTALPERIFGSK